MNKSSEIKSKKSTKKQSLFRRLWEGWKKIARKIGDFNARVILTVFYFILLFPFAVLVKLLTDPLEIKKKAHVGWHNKEDDGDLPSLDKATRQF